MVPLHRCSEAWSTLHPDIRIRWTPRPLSAFEDQPLDELMRDVDLVAIDHPHCGAAAEVNCVWPLEELLGAETIAQLAAASAGPSHASYLYEGSQLALAVDAASMVAAARDDLLGGRPAPRSWDDALQLARELPGRTALPLVPTHACNAFLALCVAGGAPLDGGEGPIADPDTGAWALATLHELHRLSHPGAARWSPPELLEQMRETDEIVYAPLTFGYVTYSIEDGRRPPVRFLSPPQGIAGIGSVLGGAGLAVSRYSQHPRAAAELAAFACSAEAQRTLVAPVGGQPGALAAWRDQAVDEAAGGFFSATLPALEAAWTRPRAPWWPHFHEAAGRVIAQALATREDPAATLAAIERLAPAEQRR